MVKMKYYTYLNIIILIREVTQRKFWSKLGKCQRKSVNNS